jgi:hypothetical protein
MMIGMTAKKIAITVPEKTLAGARRAVKSGKATSLSAYISRAIEQKTTSDDLDSLLDEMLQESGGPLTAKEKTWAAAAFAGKPIAWPGHSKPARKGRK